MSRSDHQVAIRIWSFVHNVLLTFTACMTHKHTKTQKGTRRIACKHTVRKQLSVVCLDVLSSTSLIHTQHANMYWPWGTKDKPPLKRTMRSVKRVYHCSSSHERRRALQRTAGGWDTLVVLNLVLLFLHSIVYHSALTFASKGQFCFPRSENIKPRLKSSQNLTRNRLRWHTSRGKTPLACAPPATRTPTKPL